VDEVGLAGESVRFDGFDGNSESVHIRTAFCATGAHSLTLGRFVPKATGERVDTLKHRAPTRLDLEEIVPWRADVATRHSYGRAKTSFTPALQPCAAPRRRAATCRKSRALRRATLSRMGQARPASVRAARFVATSRCAVRPHVLIVGNPTLANNRFAAWTCTYSTLDGIDSVAIPATALRYRDTLNGRPALKLVARCRSWLWQPVIGF
jgi:hypothetical protein